MPSSDFCTYLLTNPMTGLDFNSPDFNRGAILKRRQPEWLRLKKKPLHSRLCNGFDASNKPLLIMGKVPDQLSRWRSRRWSQCRQG